MIYIYHCPKCKRTFTKPFEAQPIITYIKSHNWLERLLLHCSNKGEHFHVLCHTWRVSVECR